MPESPKRLPRGLRHLCLAAMTMSFAASFAAPTAHGALIRNYKFDNNLNDAASGQTGTPTGTIAYSTSVPSAIASRSTHALSLNGTNNYVTIPFVNFFALAGTGATFSVWTNGAAQDDRRIFAEGSTASQNPMYALGTGTGGGNTGKARLFARNDENGVMVDNAGTSTTVNNSTWRHLALVDSNGSLTVYVDGSPEITRTYTRGTTSVQNTVLGALVRSGAQSFFGGLMDEAVIYNEALPQSAVQQLAGGADPTTVPEPAALGLVALAAPLVMRRRRRRTHAR